MKRLGDIDIAKGIGIILVVWAHAYGPGIRYITQFHMPFFFFVSGLLYSSADTSCKEYIVRKGKSLLLPFWWWNILMYPLYFLLFYWGDWSAAVFLKELADILITVEKVPFLGATWFLSALFWVSVCVHLVIRVLRKSRFADFFLLGAGAAVCALGFSITFPHRISRTLICSFFYISGYLYKKHLKNWMNENIKNVWGVGGGILYIFIANVNEVSLGGNEYRYKLCFIVGVFAATAFVLWVSQWIFKLRCLHVVAGCISYIGRNSLCIVIWHLLAFRVTIILQILTMHVGVKAIVAFPVYDASGMWWLVYLVTGIGISLGWQHFLKHNPLSPAMKKVHMI